MKTLWIGILAAGLIAPVAAHARSREEKQGERMEKQGEKREKRAEKEEKAGEKREKKGEEEKKKAEEDAKKAKELGLGDPGGAKQMRQAARTEEKKSERDEIAGKMEKNRGERGEAAGKQEVKDGKKLVKDGSTPPDDWGGSGQVSGKGGKGKGKGKGANDAWNAQVRKASSGGETPTESAQHPGGRDVTVPQPDSDSANTHK